MDDWRDIKTLRDILIHAENLGMEEWLDKPLQLHTPDGEWFEQLMVRFSFDHDALVIEDATDGKPIPIKKHS